MTPRAARRVRVALAAVLTVCFALAVHASMVRRLPPSIGALLSLVPLSLLTLWMFRRTHHRIAAFVAIAVVVAACVLEWPALQQHFPNLLYVEHAGGNLLLALVFGRTLVAGHEPLVTTFARITHGGLTPALARYTRQVTIAWTVFFLALFTLSSILYLGGHTDAWSTLANLLSPFLVGAMFIGEYAIRHRVLPDLERIGILGGARAFSRHFTAARLQTPR